jgi:hypothetical protein
LKPYTLPLSSPAPFSASMKPGLARLEEKPVTLSLTTRAPPTGADVPAGLGYPAAVEGVHIVFADQGRRRSS